MGVETQQSRHRLVTIVASVCLGLSALILTPTQASAAYASITINLEDSREVWYDDLSDRLLVSGDDQVLAFDPQSLAQIDQVRGLAGARHFVRVPGDDTIWVTTSEALIELDPTDLSVERTVTVPTDSCALGAAAAYGRVWLAVGCDRSALASFDPAEAAPLLEFSIASGVRMSAEPPTVFASPTGQQLYLSGIDEAGRYGLTAGRLTLKRGWPENLSWPDSFGWDDDGPWLISLPGYRLDPQTLEPLNQVQVYATSAIGSTESDRVLQYSENRVEVMLPDGSEIGSHSAFGLEPSGATWLPGEAIAWVSDGSNATLTRIGDASRRDVRLSVYSEVTLVEPGEPLRIDGSVTWQLSGVEGIEVTVERTQSGSTTLLKTVTTGTSGEFTVEDAGPRSSGPVTYSFSASGNELYSPDSAEQSVVFLADPWDFNGDGYAETAVSAPLRAVSGQERAGAVTLMNGSPEGLSPESAYTLTQDSPGMPGKAERNDQFGYATASADFTSDGYADLAISANNEAIGGRRHCGQVTVIPGGPTGLVTADAWTFDRGRRYCEDEYLGEQLATVTVQRARVNLLVTVGGEDFVENLLDGKHDSYGYAMGLGSPGKNHKPQTEGFGAQIATGDFNGDGIEDAAFAARYDFEDRGYSSGAVQVIYSEGGVPHRGQRFTLDTEGIAGKPTAFSKRNVSDQFGYALTAGDLNGDGVDELVIGAPGVDVDMDGRSRQDAGQVTVLVGQARKRLSGTRSYRITAESPGVAGTAAKDDFFGTSLEAIRDRSGAQDSLAVGEWGPQVVHVLPGGVGEGSTVLAQGLNGIPGQPSGADAWGIHLRAVYSRGLDQPADLLVGAYGEGGVGAVTVVPGTPTGMSGSGSVTWTLDTPGIPGSARPGDYWGWLVGD